MTGSVDGHVKFWKKNPGGIYFVKNYKAHLKAITSLSLSTDHLRLCSTAMDKTVKFYDVLGFDMINMLTLSFTPGQVCTMYSIQLEKLAKFLRALCSLFGSPAVAARRTLWLFQISTQETCLCIQTRTKARHRCKPSSFILSLCAACVTILWHTQSSVETLVEC